MTSPRCRLTTDEGIVYADRDCQAEPMSWGRTIVASLSALVLVAVLAGCSAEREKDDAAVAQLGTACKSAFQAAAAVPLAEINDTEMAETVTDCSTVAERAEGLARYLEALGMTRAPAESELPMSVSISCFGHESAPVCEDAASQGLLE